MTYFKKLNLRFDQQVFAAGVKLSEKPNVSTISPSSDQTLQRMGYRVFHFPDWKTDDHYKSLQNANVANI